MRENVTFRIQGVRAGLGYRYVSKVCLGNSTPVLLVGVRYYRPRKHAQLHANICVLTHTHNCKHRCNMMLRNIIIQPETFSHTPVKCKQRGVVRKSGTRKLYRRDKVSNDDNRTPLHESELKPRYRGRDGISTITITVIKTRHERRDLEV